MTVRGTYRKFAGDGNCLVWKSDCLRDRGPLKTIILVNQLKNSPCATYRYIHIKSANTTNKTVWLHTASDHAWPLTNESHLLTVLTYLLIVNTLQLLFHNLQNRCQSVLLLNQIFTQTTKKRLHHISSCILNFNANNIDILAHVIPSPSSRQNMPGNFSLHNVFRWFLNSSVHE